MSEELYSPQKRLERNVIAYLTAGFNDGGVYIRGTDDREEAPAEEGRAPVRFILSIGMDEVVNSMDPMGYSYTGTLACEITSHPSLVDGHEHQQQYQRLRSAMLADPPFYGPGEPMLLANRALLNAVNRIPGAVDMRPEDRIHLWDIGVPQETSGQGAGGLMMSALILPVNYGVWDWAGATAYAS